MYISRATLMLALLSSPSIGLALNQTQAQYPAPSALQPSGAPAANAATGPSALLQPALDGLQQTIGSLKMEKWKGGSIRSEAAANIISIQRDLQSTLPALLTQGDSAPQATSGLLPISRNINALYDVLVRVVDGARVAAPGEQVAQLQLAMVNLEKARRTFDDQIQESALAQEKQFHTVQVALKTQPVAVCPAPPPLPPAPAKKVVRKKRKPATTTPPANGQPATTPKPNQ